MDYVTRQFINLAKKLRDDLRQTLQKHTNAISQSTEAARQRQPHPLPIPLPVQAELQLPEEDKREQRRWHDQSYTLQIWLTVGTWLAFFAAAVYAGIAVLQWREMIGATGAAQKSVDEARLNRIQADKSLTATINQFQLDQRAWVGLKGFECKDCKALANGDLSIGELSVTIANTGKTPALRMTIEPSWVFRKTTDPIPTYEETTEDWKKFWQKLGGIPKDTPKEILKNMARRPKLVLPPNGTYQFLIVKGLHVPRNRVGTKFYDWGVTYGVGRITYNDAMTNTLHTTRFCIISNVTDDFSYCQIGNDMN